MGRKEHNLNTDLLYLMLSNVAPVATNALHSDITELATGNGYVAGGGLLTGQGYSQSSGTATLSASNFVWTAGGGTIGPFRYVVLYNGSYVGTAGGPLIAWWDYGSSITLQTGETFTVNLSSNIFTMA